MPTISNVVLSIRPGTSPNYTIRVAYTVRFSSIEIDARSTFMEKITLLGDDPIFNDVRTTVGNGTIVATSSSMNRSYERVVSRSVLNEDPEGGDELFARIELTPFSAVKASANSRNVEGSY